MEVIKLPLVLASKCGMTPLWFEILEPYSLSIVRLSRMESLLSSPVICIWSLSLRHGTIWYVYSNIDLYELMLHRLQGILNEVWNHKLIFVETPDANETSIALENYRRVGRHISIWNRFV